MMHLIRETDIYAEIKKENHQLINEKASRRSLRIRYIRINNLSTDEGKVYLKDGTKTRYTAYLEPRGIHEVPLFAPSEEYYILQIEDDLYIDSDIEGTINITGYYY